MSTPDSTLKGILKVCKQINASLGSSAGDTLHADVAAAIVTELAINVVIDTAITGEATSNALLDTLVTSEEAVNTVIDNCQLSIGTPAGSDSIATQFTALWAVLEGV